MKLGTSLSRCIVDIYNGKVREEDVIVLVTRTDFDPRIDDQWNNIWKGYTITNGWTASEWQNYTDKETEFREIITRMYNMGKIHQPRQFGTWVTRTNFYWYDLVLTPEILDTVPAAKTAWDKYKMIAGLTE